MGNKKVNLGDAFALPPAKPRTPVADEQASSFVEAKPLALATEVGPLQSRQLAAIVSAAEVGLRKRPAKASKLRRDDIDGARVNVYVPKDIEERLRERAFRERRSISDAVTEALEQWLGKSTKVQE